MRAKPSLDLPKSPGAFPLLASDVRACPALRKFSAALTSRSCFTSHSGHVHSLTESGSDSTMWPQFEHRLDEGKNRSALATVRPYHSALYSNCLTNSPHPACPMARVRERFLTMFTTASDSHATIPFSWIRRVESLWRKSCRWSLILACSRATLRRCFSRPLEPFTLRASFFWARRSLRYVCSKWRGLSTFSPSLVVTKCVRPRSSPTDLVVVGRGSIRSAHANETWYRPEGSSVTVQEVGSEGSSRLHRTLTRPGTFANCNLPSFTAKAVPTYRAACLLRFFDLKRGYCARPSKKLVNEVSRFRRDCCNVTALTSPSPSVSSSFFKAVRSRLSWANDRLCPAVWYSSERRRKAQLYTNLLHPNVRASTWRCSLLGYSRKRYVRFAVLLTSPFTCSFLLKQHAPYCALTDRVTIGEFEPRRIRAKLFL